MDFKPPAEKNDTQNQPVQPVAESPEVKEEEINQTDFANDMVMIENHFAAPRAELKSSSEAGEVPGVKVALEEQESADAKKAFIPPMRKIDTDPLALTENSEPQLSDREGLIARMKEKFKKIDADKKAGIYVSPERPVTIHEGNMVYTQFGKNDESKVRDGESFSLEPLTEEEKLLYAKKVQEASSMARPAIGLPDAPVHAECVTIENSGNSPVLEEKSEKVSGVSVSSENGIDNKENATRELPAVSVSQCENKSNEAATGLVDPFCGVKTTEQVTAENLVYQPVAENSLPEISEVAVVQQQKKQSAFVRMLSMFGCQCTAKNKDPSLDMQRSHALLLK